MPVFFSFNRYLQIKKLAIILVHHLRKQDDSDDFNKILGTAGIMGSSDTTFILAKKSRDDSVATLFVTGWDVADVLGDKDIQTTENYYISSTDETRKNATDSYENAINLDVIEDIIKYEIG